MGDPTVSDMAGSLFPVLWSSRLVILLLAMLIYSFGFATLVPFLPTLLTNFFASRHAGYDINCEGYDVGQQPAACQDAHAVGDLRDTYGRKPFIICGLALSTLPVAIVFMYLTDKISLLWYYPCNALTSIISTIVVFLSYTADVLQPQHRTAGFGLIIAAFSLGFMVGPLLGRVLQPTTAAIVAGSGCLVSIAVVALAVPESRQPPSAVVLHPDDNSSTHPRRSNRLDALLSLRRSWELITSSSLFMRLALCMAIVGIVSEGIQDMLIQYLQLVVGFNTSDQSLLITILGAANLVVQAGLLPWLVATLGERRLLLIGLIFSFLEQALLAVTVAKWQAYAAVSLGSLAGVAYPAISSIKSTHSRADQQGLVQGALAGIRALATGLGPLVFAQLFAMCTRTTAVFGYRPGIVFWTTGGLTLIAAAVAASIPAHLIKRPGHAGNHASSNNSTAATSPESCLAPAGDYVAVPVDDVADADRHDAPVARTRDTRKKSGLSKTLAADRVAVSAGAIRPGGSPGQHRAGGSDERVDTSRLLCAAAVAAWQTDVQSGLESTGSFILRRVDQGPHQDSSLDSGQDSTANQAAGDSSVRWNSTADDRLLNDTGANTSVTQMDSRSPGSGSSHWARSPTACGIVHVAGSRQPLLSRSQSQEL